MMVEEYALKLDRIYQHIGDLKVTPYLDSAYDSIDKAIKALGLVNRNYPEVVELITNKNTKVQILINELVLLDDSILGSNLRESTKVILTTHLNNARWCLKQEIT